MIPRSDIRFTVHHIPGSQRFIWSCSTIDYDGRGVPSIRLLEHGGGEAGDLDPVGLSAVAALLVRAASPDA